MSDTISPPVKSAMRTLDIIEYVVASDRPVTAREISVALAIPVSSLSYLLQTLVDRGYLHRDGRRHTAGAGLARLGATEANFSLAERVQPLVRSLRVQLGETASFFVRRGWELEALATETSQHALRYAVPTGAMLPLHGFSAGKALIAAMDDDELENYLNSTNREAFTATTITDADELRSEVAKIRTAGIARTDGEHTPGIQGVGRAVVAGGRVLGAFSVAVPDVRFRPEMERRVAELLHRTCALLEVG